MSLVNLFETLKDKSIKLDLDDQDNIKVFGRRDQLDQALLAGIRKNKSAIVQWLKKENLLLRPPIVPFVRESNQMPTSFAQERLWFIDQLGGGSVQYNMPGAMRIQGASDEDIVERAMARIIERHEPLRTVFVNTQEGPRQRVQRLFDFRLTRIDLSALPKAEQERAVTDAVNADAMKPFDLSIDLMLRASFLRLSREEGVLLFNTHHIASDGWSTGNLVREFVQLYEAFAQGKHDPLPSLAIQYTDYAQWQRSWLKGAVLERQLSYWERQLADLPQMHGLPLDRPRPPVQTFNGALHTVQVGRSVLAKLKQLALREQATLFMVLHGTFALLLSRHSNNQDIVIGTAVANRQQKELEPLVGFFVNTLVLRADCSRNWTFREYLAHIRSVNLDAQVNQDVSFEHLVERLKPHRSTSHTPLFQIMFSMNTNEAVELRLPRLSLTPLSSEQFAAKFDLTLEASESSEGLRLSFAYNKDLFEASTMTKLGEHFSNLLREVVDNPQEKIQALPLLTEAEQRHLLYELNDTAVPLPREICLHELFEAQVDRSPQALAVVFEDQRLSYRELNDRANQLAHYLRGQGVKADTLVGLCVERSLEMVVGILGILKAGGAYVPLEPSYPRERLEYMIADSSPALVLTQFSLLDRLPESITPMLLLDMDANQDLLREFPSHNPGRESVGLTPEHLAYVIYTSGSTGKPKGVMNEHRGVANRLLWARDACLVRSDDRVLQKTPFSFDVSVWEFLQPLLSGAQLIVAQPGGHMDPRYLAEIIEREQITVIHFIPSMLQVFLEHGVTDGCRGLRRVLCSGEALPYALWQRFTASLPGVELHNLYGPTEAAIEVTWWQCQSQVHEGIVPIGRPIANTRIYILDGERRPVPQGVTGELYLGGVGVARGYWKKPELTEQRFVKDPFREGGARMYKTGDLGRWLADGAIEYMGRNDFQVKIRGFRIELGEIEQHLAALPGVNTAVVMAHEYRPGEKRLVAYVIVERDAQPFKGRENGKIIAALRQGLQSAMPDYMVPSAFVILDKMPLTSNGKVDRKALPMPDDISPGNEYAAPQTPTEEALSSIWQMVLAMPPLSVTANFFESGGHSILAIQLIATVNKHFGSSLELQEVFQMQTVREMAKYLDGHHHPSRNKAKGQPNLLELKSGAMSVKPLFLVHPAGGYAHCYGELAFNLEYDGPVYGLQVDAAAHDESIEGMARRYIKAVRATQAEGPYVLGGWSMGGVVAYEMAQQLNLYNEGVDLLIMFDSFCPNIGARDLPGNLSPEDERMFLHMMASELGIADRGLSELEKDSLDKMTLEELFPLVLRLGREQNRLPLHFGLQELGQRYAVMLKNSAALRAYRASPLDVEIQLIRADGNTNPDWSLGWSSVAESVSVTPQSGDHFSMMRRPHVSTLTQTVSTLMQRHLKQILVPSMCEQP
jgi:amino acid adenylation domain-containing protein